jgi:hypothetical protein
MEVVVDILCLRSLEKSKTTTVLVDEKKAENPCINVWLGSAYSIFEGSAACKSCVLKTNVAIDIIIQFYGGR